MSHPGIVQLYINFKEQAEDDAINQLQLQQVHQFSHYQTKNNPFLPLECDRV